MRHLLALLVSLLVTSNLSAQTEHVKFLGIPLDGPIQQFQKELTDMGRSDGKVFLQLEGMKAFKGSYAGHDALLMVSMIKPLMWFTKRRLSSAAKVWIAASLFSMKSTNSSRQNTELFSQPRASNSSMTLTAIPYCPHNGW